MESDSHNLRRPINFRFSIRKLEAYNLGITAFRVDVLFLVDAFSTTMERNSESLRRSLKNILLGCSFLY